MDIDFVSAKNDSGGHFLLTSTSISVSDKGAFTPEVIPLNVV